MIELIWNDTFRRIFQKWVKKHPDHRSAFVQTITIFQQDPFHASLRTHSLSGKMGGLWAVRITQKYRLVFIFCENDHTKIQLVGIGNHKEVY